MQFLNNKFAKLIQPKHFSGLSNEEQVIQTIWLLNGYFMVFVMVGFVYLYTTYLTLPLPSLMLLIFSVCANVALLRQYYQSGLSDTKVHLQNIFGLVAVAYPAIKSGAGLNPGLNWLLVPIIISAFTLRNRSFYIWPMVFGSVLVYAGLFAPKTTLAQIGIFEDNAIFHRLALFIVIVIQARAISKIQAAQVSELNSLRADLKRGLEENRHLVRVLSHDLANPLSVHALSNSKLKRIELDEHKLQLIGRSEHAYHQMREIIEGVRKMIAINDGKISVELIATDLNEVVQNSVFSFKEKIDQKKLNVEVLGIAKTALADPFLLRNQVINNLLSNAIKFSYEGGHIKIELRSDAHSNYEQIVISDKGDGIPEDLIKVLFSVDYKTSRPGTAGEQGTGFGMPIVKSSVEFMKGRIRVISKTRAQHADNCGTQVTIEIPRFSSQDVLKSA